MTFAHLTLATQDVAAEEQRVCVGEQEYPLVSLRGYLGLEPAVDSSPRPPSATGGS